MPRQMKLMSSLQLLKLETLTFQFIFAQVSSIATGNTLQMRHTLISDYFSQKDPELARTTS